MARRLLARREHLRLTSARQRHQSLHHREVYHVAERQARPGTQIARPFSNPYSSVIREHVTDYFAAGTIAAYAGLAEQGVRAHYYHRTLEDYVDAFLSARLRLVKLVDVPDVFGLKWLLPNGYRFSGFMILAFEKRIQQ